MELLQWFADNIDDVLLVYLVILIFTIGWLIEGIIDSYKENK